MPIRVNTTDPAFVEMLQDRYSGFLSDSQRSEIDFEIDLTESAFADPNADVRVIYDGGRWSLRRGDFRAEWEPDSRTGWIRQAANPYSIDAVLRIVHSIVLAKQGGYLMHSASAIRNGKAFLFAGVSRSWEDDDLTAGPSGRDPSHRTRSLMCANKTAAMSPSGRPSPAN